MNTSVTPRHPYLSRRAFLQAGTIGALGCQWTEVAELRGGGPPVERVTEGRDLPFLTGLAADSHEAVG